MIVEIHTPVEGKKKTGELTSSRVEPVPRLQIVIKADTVGTREAILSAISTVHTPGVEIEVIQAEIGHVSKSDLFLAETGSRVILGFNVDILPRIKQLALEREVEVRLYSVIYNLVDDLKKIATGLVPAKEQEDITGKARVIALFSGGRKGIILGCEVLEGTIAIGNKFKIISAPGPVYSGTVESMHIEKETVKEAKIGQQVGLRIPGFKRAKLGDMVECFRVRRPKGPSRWQPRGGVFRID